MASVQETQKQAKRAWAATKAAERGEAHHLDAASEHRKAERMWREAQGASRATYAQRAKAHDQAAELHESSVQHELSPAARMEGPAFKGGGGPAFLDPPPEVRQHHVQLGNPAHLAAAQVAAQTHAPVAPRNAPGRTAGLAPSAGQYFRSDRTIAREAREAAARSTFVGEPTGKSTMAAMARAGEHSKTDLGKQGDAASKQSGAAHDLSRAAMQGRAAHVDAASAHRKAQHMAEKVADAHARAGDAQKTQYFRMVASDHAKAAAHHETQHAMQRGERGGTFYVNEHGQKVYGRK